MRYLILILCLLVSAPALSENTENGLLTSEQLQELKSKCGEAIGGQVMVPTWVPDYWILADFKVLPGYGYDLIYSAGMTQFKVTGRADKGRGGDAHPQWDGTLPYKSATFGDLVMGHITDESRGYSFGSGWLTQGPGKPVYMLNGTFRIHREDKEKDVVRLAESLKLLRL